MALLIDASVPAIVRVLEGAAALGSFGKPAELTLTPGAWLVVVDDVVAMTLGEQAFGPTVPRLYDARAVPPTPLRAKSPLQLRFASMTMNAVTLQIFRLED